MNKGHDSSSGDIINKEEKLKTNGQTEGYMFPKRFESLNNSLNGVFKQYFDTIPTVANNLSQSLELFGERFKKIMPDISLQLNRMQNLFTPLEQTINSIREQYTHLFVSMPPPMTNEDKERIRNAYVEWGNYGWTIIYWADTDFQSSSPGSLAEANKKALACCTNNDLAALFSELYKLRGIKKDDLNEAILDFNDKRYKSCAMIIFSIIDARLIRLQRKEDMSGRYRKSGKLAAKKIRERIEQEHELNKTYFLLFSVENTFAAINSLFREGEDFKKQPDLLNRNFLDHGMLHRKVKRMDCIQLFLLLYNLFDLLQLVF